MFKARLVGHGPRPREIEVTADSPPLTFGRGAEVGERVNDRWTSRRHCQLYLEAGVLWVDDLGSTHGTHVNGRETMHAPLAEGDVLHVGLSTFRITYVTIESPAARRVGR